MQGCSVTVSLRKLLEKDSDEEAALKHAFKDIGFVYLDLRGHEDHSGPILPRIEATFRIAAEYFSLDAEEKMKFDIDKIGKLKLHGYKPVGRNAGVAQNSKDGFEAYLLPRDGMCHEAPGHEELRLPSILRQHDNFLANLLESLHGVGLEILACLEDDKNKGGLTGHHLHSKPSTSAFGLLRYPSLSENSPELGQSAHTDVGSLTILFISDRGLQVLNPAGTEWHYIEPKDGCAVVNVGDSLRFLSDRLYKSSLHRVVPYPEVEIQDRYSCAYFMRPGLDAEFVDDEGKKWKSLDWHANKYSVFRAPVKEQMSSSVLTGKQGFVGLWQANDGKGATD